MVESKDCAHAWQSALRAVISKGEWVEAVKDEKSVGSNFGTKSRKFLEICSYALRIANPSVRTILSQERRVNQPFCVANFLWTVSGSPWLNDIESFNRKATSFAVDGVLQSAPGIKIWGNGSDQWETLVKRLTDDPSTRRALLHFSDCSDFKLQQRDIPCMQTMQFLIRRDRLHCVVSMRSQSALMVMPYDLFLYTMIHELVAATIGVELGSFTQFVGSMHVYEDEVGLCSSVLSQDAVMTTLPMPSMKREDARMIELVGQRYLTFVRSNCQLDYSLLAEGLTDYWANLFAVLSGHQPQKLSYAWSDAFGLTTE